MHCKRNSPLHPAVLVTHFRIIQRLLTPRVDHHKCLPNPLLPLPSWGLFSPGACGWGWGWRVVAKTFNRNPGSSSSVFLLDYSKAELQKVSSEVSKSQNCFNTKGAFCLEKENAALREICIFLDGFWGRDIPMV